MAEKVTFDGAAKTITIKAGVTEINVQTDLYMTWVDWVREGNAEWLPAFRADGRAPTNADQTQFTPSYFFLLNGWTIVGNTGENISIQTNLYPDPDGTTTTANMFTTSNNTNIFNRQSDAPTVASEFEKILEYGGVIYIDANAAESGSTYPYGTAGAPVNNALDAQLIRQLYGISTFVLAGELFVPGGTFQDFTINGMASAKVTADGNASFVNGVVNNCTLEGDLGSGSSNMQYNNCEFTADIKNLDGIFKSCMFVDRAELGEGSQPVLVNCFSNCQDTAGIVFDFGVDTITNNLDLRDFMGKIIIDNVNSPTKVANLGMSSGRITLNDTCTDGTIGMAGLPYTALVDNSSGNIVIKTDLLLASHNTLEEALEGIAYSGMVTIDIDNGFAGTEYPIGTHDAPVNNLSDALAIISSHNLHTLHLHSNLVIDQDIQGLRIEGVNGGEMITIMGVDVRGTYIYNVIIAGSIVSDGQIRAENCQIAPGTTGLSGAFKTCGIMGDITLTNPEVSAMIDCFTVKMSPLLPDPTLYFGEVDDGYIANWSFVNFANGVKIANINSADTFVDFNSSGSQIEILDSNTNGTIRITGVSDNSVINNGNGITVDVDTLAASAVQLNETLEKIDYNDVVHIDVNDGFAGTEYPIGTAKYPSNNIAEARTIAETNNIYTFEIQSDLTISEHMEDGYVFRGKSSGEVISLTGTNIPEATFENCYLQGNANSDRIRIRGCKILGLQNFNGGMWDTLILNDITLAPDTDTVLRNCFAGSLTVLNNDTSTPRIIFGTLGDNASYNFNIRGWTGPLQISNMDAQTKSAAIHVDSGYLIIDDSNTDGYIFAQGLNVNGILDLRTEASNLFINIEELKHTTDDESRRKSKADLSPIL